LICQLGELGNSEKIKEILLNLSFFVQFFQECKASFVRFSQWYFRTFRYQEVALEHIVDIDFCNDHSKGTGSRDGNQIFERNG
jgi:hypothetical protein